MKKMLSLLLAAMLGFGFISDEASARVGTISVMNNYNKSASTANLYIKNSDNKADQYVKLELQRNGKTISTQTVCVKKNTQIKKPIKLTLKGKYRIKYTVKGKYSYTNNFNY
jgi:hypothetical protein